MSVKFLIDTEKVLEDISLSKEHSIQNIDWSQFVPTLLATFLAFALTLLASYIYDVYKDSKSRKRVIKNIRRELKSIISSISTVKKSIINKNLCTMWVMPLKTYFWDAVLSTNEISLIADEEWYNDLLDIYHSIQEYNMWHMIRTEAIMKQLENDDIREALLTLGDTITSKIMSVTFLYQEDDK